MLNLAALPSYYLDKFGLPKVAEVLGKPPSLVAMWKSKSKFPLEAVSRLLEFDPAPLGAITPLYPENKIGAKLAIMMPCAGKPEPETVETLMRLYDPAEMTYKRFNFNSLPIARNAMFAWWMAQTQIEWGLLADSDSVFPCGDAALFRELCDLPDMPDAYAGLNTIYRMLVHKKKCVSVCYVGRRKGAPPQFSGGDTAAIRAKIKKGPRNELHKVDACGFGGLLIHRSVIEDVISQQGDEMRHNSPYLKERFGYEYALCDPTTKETPGDDYPLCSRIRRAGHEIFVDLSVMAGHVGSKVYTFNDL